MPWIDVEETPETITANVMIDQVMAIRRRLTDRLSLKEHWNDEARRRLARRLRRLDELSAIQVCLVVWRDSIWNIPSVGWRPLS